MKFLAVLLVVAAAFALTEDENRFMFEEFRARFQRSYGDAHEAMMRFTIFKHNMARVASMNAAKDGAEYGITPFSDMTPAEFSAYVNMGKLTIGERKNIGVTNVDAPDDIDWTTKGVVNAVRNQGSCGSCWAFSAVGAMESIYAIKSGTLYDLSEQNFVDCDKQSSGCNGGWMDYAFEHAIKMGGTCLETDYPYTARTETCKESGKTHYAKITSYTDIPANNNDALKNALALGPVSVAIQADQAVFQNYKSGIIQSGCGTSLNHGVVAVGYGVEGGVKYWKLRNSWAASWGDHGYVRILRIDGTGAGMCGVAKAASYPVA